MQQTDTPICPLISAGVEIPQLCQQEKCAWYVKAYKMCSIYVIAHNAALDIKTKTPPGAK